MIVGRPVAPRRPVPLDGGSAGTADRSTRRRPPRRDPSRVCGPGAARRGCGSGRTGGCRRRRPASPAPRGPRRSCSTMQNVATAPWRCRTASTWGVHRGSGPSSKVSATVWLSASLLRISARGTTGPGATSWTCTGGGAGGGAGATIGIGDRDRDARADVERRKQRRDQPEHQHGQVDARQVAAAERGDPGTHATRVPGARATSRHRPSMSMSFLLDQSRTIGRHAGVVLHPLRCGPVRATWRW